MRDRLASELSGSELQSLLIDVFSERAKSITPATVLSAYERDRFVRPSSASPLDILEFDRAAYAVASTFEAIELSPVCPLGTNTSVAPMSQNRVLGTIRNTEVVADSTNVMALECAIRRRELLKNERGNSSLVKLCSSHRLLRTQKYSGADATAHFRVFALCTAGRDTGGFEFEANSMAEHLSTYLRLFKTLKTKDYRFGDISIGIYGTDDILVSKIIDRLKDDLPGHPIKRLGSRESNYYPVASFTLNIKTHAGTDLNIGDGGFTDWTQSTSVECQRALHD